MYKSKIIKIVVIFLILIGLISTSYATENNTLDGKFHKIDALAIPEKNINFKVENLTIGCEVYLLLPNELFSYNIEKFINNNLENNYNIQKEKAEKIKEYYDNKDYLGYIEYLEEFGYDVEENELELRHYAICINEKTEIIGYVDYNQTTYVKIKLNMKDNEFKLITKDYLVQYDFSKILFLIDEYGVENYIPVSNYNFVPNSEKNNINECNINYVLESKEDYDSINRAIFISYIIIFIIIFVIVLLIVIHEIKKYKKNKKEIEERLFYKKKTTKQEKKDEKKRIREELKEIKKKRKRNKR